MAVLDPIKLVITNYPEGQIEELEAENNPENENGGHALFLSAGELWIEREDFYGEPFQKILPSRAEA